MSGLKATEQDRLYLSGAIHRMGERTGSAAERILDDLDTLLAENVRLRAVAEALRAERRILQGPPLPPNTKRSATMRYFDAQQETDAALAALEAP